VRRAAGCAGAALLIVAVLSGCGGSHPATPPYGSGRGAPSISQISHMLSRHARAVLSKDTGAFLADVDPTAASSEYRSRATAEVAALSTAPLRSWSYSIAAPVLDRPVVMAAAKRLGGPVSIMHVTVSYQLAFVDDEPVTHDLWWTFVRRHGSVFVAADSDMSRVGGVSWQGPWDFGPLVSHRGSACLVLSHPADSGPAAGLVADVDAAVGEVTSVWGTRWSQRVAVILPATAAEFTAESGVSASGAGADIAAVTVFETPADNSGARVIVNPDSLGRLTALGRTIVLRHEITHVATAAATAIGSPRWVVEGFAEYVANLGTGQPVGSAAAELRAQVAAGNVPAALPTDADFGTGAAVVYEESWLACRLIAAIAGPGGLVHFYTLVGAGLQTPEQAVDGALRSVAHESTATFVARWRAYLRAQL
jgi:hypothetical protein